MRVLTSLLVLVVFIVSMEAGAKTAVKANPALLNRPANVDEAQDFSDLKERTGDVIDDTLRMTRDLQPTCFDCDSSQPGFPSKQCRDTYSDLYSRDTLDFRYVFGYVDQYNAEDGPARAAAVEALKRPCGSFLQGACGFTYESDDNDEVLVKKMRGPDGREKTIRLTIMNSSVSTNLAKNRGPLAVVQTNASRRAREEFEGGLRDSDMTIYVGHGRDGGGPSFEPPRLRANGSVDLTWYHRNTDSKNAMVTAIRTATRAPKLVGVFACYSGMYFANDMRKASPKTGFVGSTGYTALDALYSQSFAMLDSVLSMRCENEFKQELHQLKEVTEDPSLPATPQAAPVMKGVFDRTLPAAVLPTVAQPHPEVPVEEIPTGETVRPEYPSATIPRNQMGGDLSQPILPDGVKSQPRSTTPTDGAR